ADERPCAPRGPVGVRARDGFDLVCYLSRPRDAAPGKPLPMVLCVHGGPWSRDFWGFQPTHQWLADRGYAALSVNYRGSTGFGKAYRNAGDGEIGGAPQNHLRDAVAPAGHHRVGGPQPRGRVRRLCRRPPPPPPTPAPGAPG